MMDLSSIARVEGPSLTLRLIQPEDAAYVHSLRNNPAYNTKSREAHGQEFYYVIERKNGTRCGLVRLYDIEAESFTWGSWILDEKKPRKAALESAVLIYTIGFDGLACDRAVFDVRNDNIHTLAFHRRFGAHEVASDELNVYFNYEQSQFAVGQTHYLNLLR
jgi:RimJ/RimL family protein N-acetyltransferase